MSSMRMGSRVLLLLVISCAFATCQDQPSVAQAKQAAQNLTAVNPPAAAAIKAALVSDKDLCSVPSGYLYSAPVLSNVANANATGVSSSGQAGRRLLSFIDDIGDFVSNVGSDIVQGVSDIPDAVTTATSGIADAAKATGQYFSENAGVAVSAVGGAVVTGGLALAAGAEAGGDFVQEALAAAQAAQEAAAAGAASLVPEGIGLSPEIAEALLSVGLLRRRLLADAAQPATVQPKTFTMSQEQYDSIDPCCLPTIAEQGDTADSLTTTHNLPAGLLVAMNVVDGKFALVPGSSVTIPCARFLSVYTAYTTVALAKGNATPPSAGS